MKRLGFLFLVLAVVGALVAPAWAAPNLAMTARAAAEGRVKSNGWTTVVVELSNQGGELAGDLVVEPGQQASPGFQQRPQYVVPVSLAAGAQKKIAVDVPMSAGNSVRVQFRVGGRVVQEQTLTLTMLSPQSTLIGVLAGDELGIPALNARQGADVHVVRLDAETFPARAGLLEAYTVIAISRYDTSPLSQEQRKALEVWVGRGGTLVLAGGPEWRRTLSALPPALVPVSLTGVREVDLASLGALTSQTLTAKGPVSEGRALRGQVVASAEGIPLVLVDTVGTGRVVYLAADPGLAPLAGWPGQAELFQRYAGGTTGNIREWNDTDPAMLSALQRIPGLGLPSVLTLVGLVLGYLLLVGPVNYLVLKRMDQREWMWLTIPVLSVVVVAASYGITVGRRTPLLAHLVTVTELAPGTSAATMKSYVGVYAPSRRALTVGLEHADLVKPLTTTYGGSTDGSTRRVVVGEKTTVELLGLNGYTMQGFSMQQDVAVAGGLDLVEAEVKGGVLTGRVANRTGQTVAGLQVFTGFAGTDVGTLAPGAVSESFTLPLGGQMQGPQGRGVPGVMRPSMPVAGIGIVAGPEGGPAAPMRSAADWQQQQAVWNGTFGWGKEQIPASALILAGWTAEPISKVNLPDLGKVVQGLNLVHTRASIPMDLAHGDIPAGLILGVPTGGKNAGRTPTGWLLQPDTYSWSLTLPVSDRAQVAEILPALVVYNGAMPTVEARNWATNAWVAVKLDQPLAGWQDFVRPDGTLELRTTVSMHTEMTSPTVAIKGVSR